MFKYFSLVLKYAAYLVALFAAFTLWRGCKKVGKDAMDRSMEPMIDSSQTSLSINPLIKSIQTLDSKEGLKRGDVIAFHDPRPAEYDTILVRRIIALPGQFVSIKNGVVFIRDTKNSVAKKDTEFVVILKSDARHDEIMVPRDTVYVLGDNRKASPVLDSRKFGPVSVKLIIGKYKQ